MGLQELSAFAILVIASAAHVTVHVALLFGLFRRGPALRALAALLLPPLAPFWGYEVGLKKRSAAWLVSLVVYVVALTLCLL